MGFPLVCYCVFIPKPVIAFCKLVGAVRDALMLLLSLVGLCRSPRRSVDDAPLPEEVKARLPAVEFSWLARPEQQQQGCHDGAAACIVCLERLEAADEVRRLGNCAHAFHRGCIDGWIDLGRTTCPLCRSHLLPRARRASPSLLTRVW
ncbi:RING finger protein [Hordeum vulgare]|uniref:Predicted protein n=1 Tax=Hordeum vulgare subsp. vulgare TaxID=112509 RepID=F2DAQ1_HORVV|nr:brassinosteroid-responsive RING protein 1-like [Hordeum vulgare subsp. vulgare]KAE8793521.1 RING finger protein [Hordeum vulgare]KAI4981167.1 hypothetical protein ZWY2020_021652 [Hordeum vulgare]BAJ92172.1 predicted protein [Hordeum vulgare subsp. vulgare]